MSGNDGFFFSEIYEVNAIIHDNSRGLDEIIGVYPENFAQNQWRPTIDLLQIDDGEDGHIVVLPYPKDYAVSYGYSCPLCFKNIRGSYTFHRHVIYISEVFTN